MDNETKEVERTPDEKVKSFIDSHVPKPLIMYDSEQRHYEQIITELSVRAQADTPKMIEYFRTKVRRMQ